MRLGIFHQYTESALFQEIQQTFHHHPIAHLYFEEQTEDQHLNVSELNRGYDLCW
ncbi:hypothetical protein D3C85_1581330 [compost metagenome]